MVVYTGLGDIYVGGRNLSGDAGTIQRIGGGPALLDVSTVDLVGMQRNAGRRDGEISFSSYLNPETSPPATHAYLSTFPAVDVAAMVLIEPAPGSPAAMLVAKLVDYAPVVGQDLAASFNVQALASAGFPLVWGKTIAQRTDTGATASGTGIDLGIPDVAALDIVSTSEDDPTVITTDGAHGLQTGDSVLIAGDDSVPSLNGGHTVTVISPTTFSVPVEVTTAGDAGTVQRTSWRGWEAQVQVTSVTGTSVTPKLQNAPNNVAGQFADLTGGGFTTVAAAAVAGQRIASAAGIVQRFVRLATTGTFNPAVLAAAIAPRRG